MTIEKQLHQQLQDNLRATSQRHRQQEAARKTNYARQIKGAMQHGQHDDGARTPATGNCQPGDGSGSGQ